MSIVPFNLIGTRANVLYPTVGQFFGSIVQTSVFAFGQGVVVNGGFYKIAGHIAFVIAPVTRRPAAGPAGGVAQSVGCVQVAVGFLSR